MQKGRKERRETEARSTDSCETWQQNKGTLVRHNRLRSLDSPMSRDGEGGFVERREEKRRGKRWPRAGMERVDEVGGWRWLGYPPGLSQGRSGEIEGKFVGFRG